MGGSSSFIPAPAVMHRGADILGGLPLIRHTRQLYANTFKQPTKGMDDLLVYARNKRTGQTADIIHSAIKLINKDFKHMKPENRKAALRAFVNGGRDASPDAAVVADNFDRLLEYYQRGVRMPDGEPLTVSRINAMTPEEYRVAKRSNEITDSRDLINSLKGVRSGVLDDPYKILWNLHIATAQAEARMAMEYVIKDGFGIRRMGKVRNGRFVAENTDLGKSIERLGNKDTDWKTIPELGDSHYFPPDMVKDIQRLMDSFDPRNIQKLAEYFDQGTRAWKAIATIYNPGYWTRNGIGEMMATWMAGHQNPKDYLRSANMIKYMTGEGKDLESLKKHFVLNEPLVGDDSIKGSRVAFSMRSGQKVTYEELTRHFNDQGLNTGFFNDEFERNKVADRLLQSPGTSQMVGAHRKMRDWGENFENFLRNAHFIAKIRKSNKSLEDAAMEAAQEVRRYHFDYTDYTKFEKTVMLRVFPFYKWTRRAMPLFFGMLFTKPGKMTAYSKVANATSNYLTSQDVDDDPNGFLPNYSGIVPGFIQDLMGYQVAGDTQTGTGDYLNVQTPQMDSLKSLFNPGTTAYSMFNPYLKAAIEQPAGHTFGDQFGSYSLDFHDKDKGNLNRMNALLNSFPGGKFGSQATVKGNSLNRGELLSFLTGGGDYENTPAMQYAEEMERKK
jgi:hypothetical protein